MIKSVWYLTPVLLDLSLLYTLMEFNLQIKMQSILSLNLYVLFKEWLGMWEMEKNLRVM